MKIEKAIVHWVPNINNEAQPKKFSQNIVKKEDLNSVFWIDKIKKAINHPKTFDIEFINENNPGFVFSQTECLIQYNNNEQFIKCSHEIANHLFHIQNKKNISDGFLIIFYGTTDNYNKFVCLFKLEGIIGSEALFDEKTNSFKIKQIDSIIITTHTKIFKMAYIEYEVTTIKRILAMDDQRTEKELSNFWLKDFLECKIIENEARLTKQFFDFIKKFSENKRLEFQESMKIKTALYAELNSNSKMLSITEFKEKYIPEYLYSLFEKEKERSKIYLRDFPKKIDKNLKKKLLIRKFILEDGIEVNIPISVLEEERKAIIENRNTESYLKINARILKEK